jgi:hypothetical protein
MSLEKSWFEEDDSLRLVQIFFRRRLSVARLTEEGGS